MKVVAEFRGRMVMHGVIDLMASGLLAFTMIMIVIFFIDDVQSKNSAILFLTVLVSIFPFVISFISRGILRFMKRNVILTEKSIMYQRTLLRQRIRFRDITGISVDEKEIIGEDSTLNFITPDMREIGIIFMCAFIIYIVFRIVPREVIIHGKGDPIKLNDIIIPRSVLEDICRFIGERVDTEEVVYADKYGWFT